MAAIVIPTWMMWAAYIALWLSYAYRKRLESELRPQLSAVIWALVPNVVFYSLMLFSPPFATLAANEYAVARLIKRWADLLFILALLGNSPVIPFVYLRAKTWWKTYGSRR